LYINVLAMQDPRLVYDLLLVGLGNFEKFWKSQRNPNWDDWFCTLGTEPVPASALHCIVPGAAGLIK
jgi:hypothetical protein